MVVLLSFIAVSFVLVCQADGADLGTQQWRLIFQGVELTELNTEQPRMMRGHAARIDLRGPGISFVTTADNGPRPLETDGLRTSSFLRVNKCQLAINAAPFKPFLGRSV